jgi:hypothetical protein
MALNGTTAAGPQVLDLTAGHIQPLADTAAVTGAAVQVSFDDGRTWDATHVTSLGRGNYRVTYTAPAGAYVTLRTTATDAAGGSLTEATPAATRSPAELRRLPSPAPAGRPETGQRQPTEDASATGSGSGPACG